MSGLERWCRLLLIAYPAEYRRERGEEIVGTLLDATPPGRGCPQARDVRALIIGGLRARAAANRRLGGAADIRLGVLLGVALELSAGAAGFLRDFATGPATFPAAPDTAASGWRELLAGLLIAAAVTCAWRGRGRLLVACALAVAAAVIWLLVHQPAYDSRGFVVTTVSVGTAGSLLLCVAVLILLARRAERPARSWLWLIGLIVVTESLPGLMPRHLLLQSWLMPALLLTMLIVPIAWIAVDARPAVGLATYLALEVVTIFGDRVRLGAHYLVPPVLAQAATIGSTVPGASAMWSLYAILLAVGGPALWRLRRRQASH